MYFICLARHRRSRRTPKQLETGSGTHLSLYTLYMYVNISTLNVYIHIYIYTFSVSRDIAQAATLLNSWRPEVVRIHLHTIYVYMYICICIYVYIYICVYMHINAFYVSCDIAQAAIILNSWRPGVVRIYHYIHYICMLIYLL